MAAHITAASPGGPRYDPGLDPDLRQAATNGLWLCQTDAKIIDDDELRFTPDLLTAWRLLAERLAAKEQGRPITGVVSRHGIVDFDRAVAVDSEQLRYDVHTFLEDVGALAAWSAHADLVYMTLYEIALNAVQHGRASKVALSSANGRVMLHDDGEAFGLSDLRRGGRGGHLALSQLEKTAAGSVTVRHQRSSGSNVWTLIDERAELGGNTPCSFAVKGSGVLAATTDAARRDVALLDDCEELHVYAPRLWSISDWAVLFDELQDLLADRVLVVHGVGQSSAVRPVLERLRPQIRFPD